MRSPATMAMILLLAAATPAPAALVNPSFELDSVTLNGFTPNNPTGWSVTETVAGNVGVLNGTQGVPGATAGDQHAFINSNNGQEHTLWQKMVGPLQANTLYTVTFDIANRDRGNDGLESKDTNSDPNTTVKAFFTLGADDDDDADAVGTIWSATLSTITNGTYLLDQTISFSTVGLGDLNQALNLVFWHQTTGTETSQSNWDNVRLELTPVPAPAALPAGVAMLMLIAPRRRRVA